MEKLFLHFCCTEPFCFAPDDEGLMFEMLAKVILRCVYLTLTTFCWWNPSFYVLVQGRIQEKMWPVSKRVSAKGASRLGGSGGMLPRKILKIWLSKTLFPAFSGLKINLGWEHGLKIKCSFHSPLLRCVQVPFSGDGVLQILQLPHPRHHACRRFSKP